MNNIIFFGPPGAGKGTQAKIISNYLNVPHLSTGDILRTRILQEDDLSKNLKEIMSSGRLVSDEILNKIVNEKLNDCNDGFILDGYPRTLDQSNFLNNYLMQSRCSLDFIFNIDISFDVLKDRILKRSEEEDRDDDNINALETRYAKYMEETKPVSEEYKQNNSSIFYEINGRNQIQEITSEIIKILEK